MKRRSLRSLFVWMASVAVLMGALAPSISQALQADGAPAWSLVCTSLGSQWVQADGKTRKPDAAHLFEHCPYCTLHAVALETPTVRLQAPLRAVSHQLHWCYAAATPTLDFWSDALSRGPPLSV